MENIYVAQDLELRTIQDAHATDLFNLIDANRTYLRTWLPWLDHNRSLFDVQAYVRFSQQRNAGGEALVQTIFYRDKVCGIAGFNFIDRTNRWGEIGYWLDQSHQGKGIVTSCITKLMNYGFDKMNIHRISLSIGTKNTKSLAIAERLNFRKEGTLRQCEWLYDHYVDHDLYAFLASDRTAT